MKLTLRIFSSLLIVLTSPSVITLLIIGIFHIYFNENAIDYTHVYLISKSLGVVVIGILLIIWNLYYETIIHSISKKVKERVIFSLILFLIIFIGYTDKFTDFQLRYFYYGRIDVFYNIQLLYTLIISVIVVYVVIQFMYYIEKQTNIK